MCDISLLRLGDYLLKSVILGGKAYSYEKHLFLSLGEGMLL